MLDNDDDRVNFSVTEEAKVDESDMKQDRW